MSRVPSPGKRYLVAAALVAAVAVAVAGWRLRPGVRSIGSNEELLRQLIAAKEDERDDTVVELGRRGASVIPLAVGAYRSAGNDPVLRSQLALVIFRTGAAEEGTKALETILQDETDPDVRSAIQNFRAEMERDLRRTVPG